ncbi:hypothetical protein TCAL_08136, partial [Tigriopus californicus]
TVDGGEGAPPTVDAAQRAAALAAKLRGNEAYKKKDLDTAWGEYTTAVSLDPTDMTFVSNLAAVQFERKDYPACVAECQRALQVGREHRADFKLMAKAWARLGNAAKRLGQLDTAKMAFEKALTEHRTPDYRTSLSEIESLIKKKNEQDYINPELAEEEKQAGNACFKSGDFSGAVKRYSEAIRRNPSDSKIYSNRAACYTKLMSFDLALKDCEKAIELDPQFIKAFLRKAMVHKGMGQTSKAQATYEKALELDPNCTEAMEGYRSCAMQSHTDPEEVRKRAMNDPEVQRILNDPAMRMILEQMQSDPNAIQDHLKNPAIAEKFMKLREAGLIQVAYK